MNLMGSDIADINPKLIFILINTNLQQYITKLYIISLNIMLYKVCGNKQRSDISCLGAFLIGETFRKKTSNIKKDLHMNVVQCYGIMGNYIGA